jgi:uncharacterized phage protein (TIGR02218 family)
MRQLHPEFAAHLAGDCTTLCTCWAVALSDGRVLGFTDHDEALAFDDTLFEPESGFTGSEVETRTGLSTDGFDIAGALSSSRIEITDIEAGRYDGAEVTVQTVNWRTPSQRVIVHQVRIGRIKLRGEAFVAELVSATADLGRTRGRIFSKLCDARLGDERCGFALSSAPHLLTATVTGVAGSQLTLSSAAPPSDDWFIDGECRSPKLPCGYLRISAQKPGVVALDIRLSGDATALDVGDSVMLVAGCDKRFATCKLKFANTLDFQGFPHLPGNDAAYGYATGGETYDGGPLVP